MKYKIAELNNGTFDAYFKSSGLQGIFDAWRRCGNYETQELARRSCENEIANDKSKDLVKEGKKIKRVVEVIKS